MKSLLLSAILLISLPSFGQELAADEQPNISQQTVEVGKHVAGELDSMSMILSLLLVLALIIGSAWVLKKFQGVTQHSSDLKIITSLPLGSKERLVVVQVGKKQLLLGLSGQQINLLDTLDEPLEQKKAIPTDLTQSIARFITKKNPDNSNQTMAKHSND